MTRKGSEYLGLNVVAHVARVPVPRRDAINHPLDAAESGDEGHRQSQLPKRLPRHHA